MSICPKCAGPQNCPCENCRMVLIANGIYDKDEVTWSYQGDFPHESQVCGHCGFTASLDYWLDWEYIQMEMEAGPVRLTYEQMAQSWKILYWYRSNRKGSNFSCLQWRWRINLSNLILWTDQRNCFEDRETKMTSEQIWSMAKVALFCFFKHKWVYYAPFHTNRICMRCGKFKDH